MPQNEKDPLSFDTPVCIVEPTHIERSHNSVTKETLWVVRFKVLSGETTILVVYQIYHSDPTANITVNTRYRARITGGRGGLGVFRVVILPPKDGTA